MHYEARKLRSISVDAMSISNYIQGIEIHVTGRSRENLRYVTHKA